MRILLALVVLMACGWAGDIDKIKIRDNRAYLARVAEKQRHSNQIQQDLIALIGQRRLELEEKYKNLPKTDVRILLTISKGYAKKYRLTSMFSKGITGGLGNLFHADTRPLKYGEPIELSGVVKKGSVIKVTIEGAGKKRVESAKLNPNWDSTVIDLTLNNDGTVSFKSSPVTVHEIK
jgi:hypothetical protein